MYQNIFVQQFLKLGMENIDRNKQLAMVAHQRSFGDLDVTLGGRIDK